MTRSKIAGCFALAFILGNCVTTQHASVEESTILPSESLSSVGAPLNADSHTIVWTGSDLLVWGGQSDTENMAHLGKGGAYNLASNAWRSLTDAYAPHARIDHTAVWTGEDMVVWGGQALRGKKEKLASGGSYSPSSETWEAVAINGAPAARSNHTAVWAKNLKKMIVWGGEGRGKLFGNGGVFDPAKNTWTALSGEIKKTKVVEEKKSDLDKIAETERAKAGDQEDGEPEDEAKAEPAASDDDTGVQVPEAPSPRMNHSAVWTGKEMIIWGGVGDPETGALGDGSRYNPKADKWYALPKANAPSPRYGHTAVWTGKEMIVWGGWSGREHLKNGAAYDPKDDSWRPLSLKNAPSARTLHVAVVVDNKMIVHGGLGISAKGDKEIKGDAFIYNIDDDTWSNLAFKQPITPRYGHSAVNADSHIIIWGGRIDDWKLVAKDVGVMIATAEIGGKAIKQKAIKKAKKKKKSKKKPKPQPEESQS